MPLQIYETQIRPTPNHFHRGVGVTVVPAAVLQEAGIAPPDTIQALASFVEELGFVPGVALETPDDMANYVYAGLYGRGTDFGFESSGRWGSQRARGGATTEAANDVVWNASIPIEASPVQGRTLADLIAGVGGTAITIGAPVVFGPVGLVGSLVAVLGGLVYVTIVRPVFEAGGEVAKFKLYERFGLEFLYPTDDPQLRAYLIRRHQAKQQGLPPPPPPELDE